MARTTPFGVACAALAAIWLAGCGPKLVRTPVFQKDKPGVRVELQHRVQSDAVIPRGFDQPATISDVRIAHILANLTYEGKDKDAKRQPAIRSEFVYDLAAGISTALAQATADDEIAAAAFPEDRRLGIFSDNRVTSFRLHLEGDSMQIEFMNIEDPLEKEGKKVGFSEYQIPSDFPSLAPLFVLQPSESITKLGTRGVSVAWRDDLFRRPVSLVSRDGKIKKRTVLMELPPEKETDPKLQKPARPEGLSDAQVSALDKLDAARASGSVTEQQYQHRRRLILENKLEESGDEPTTP
jgi:hypothetical protein